MIRIGLIGCGYIAKKHVQTISRFNHMSLIAVSDLYQYKMKEITNDYHQHKQENTPISFYRNHEYLLADPRVDVVIISTVSSLHAEMTKKALQNNKHVIVEKPLALSLHEANQIINLAQKVQKKVLVCHQLRYRPLIKKIRQLIQQGYFGELYFGAITLMLNRSTDYYDSDDWKGTWKKDGGMLINQGIHLVDLLLWMMGDIQSVYGEISTKLANKETEDIALGIINFKNGAKGLVDANTITTPENLGYYLSVFGEKGSVRIGGKTFNKLEHCYIEDSPDIVKELELISNRFDEHYLMYENFYHSIVGKENIVMTAEESRKALEGIFSLYESSIKNKPIYLPLQEFSTEKMGRKQ